MWANIAVGETFAKLENLGIMMISRHNETKGTLDSNKPMLMRSQKVLKGGTWYISRINFSPNRGLSKGFKTNSILLESIPKVQCHEIHP